MIDRLLNDEWIQKLRSFDTLFVGYSGGLDSSVLLHCLVSKPFLRKKLTAVHIHHGLSSNADAWQQHCLDTCLSLTIPFITKNVDLAITENFEEAARNARYQVFSSLVSNNDCLILGHHLNDQAETLLLQLFRGAGVDGMASMSSKQVFAKGTIIRPFLNHSRQILERYAQLHALSWVEDESNDNHDFSRNYIRQTILPLIQSKWPGVVKNLSRSATLCQQAKKNLEELALLDCSALTSRETTLSLPGLQHLGKERAANVLRCWLKFNNIRMPTAKLFQQLVDNVIHAAPDANPSIQWDDIVIKRYQRTLYLLNQKTVNLLSCNHKHISWDAFPYPIKLKIGTIAAVSGKGHLNIPLSSVIEIRFRVGGETLVLQRQTKQLKKLLQLWQIPPWERDSLPLLYINGELAAVLNYAISDHFYTPESKEGYLLDFISCL